MIRRLVRAGSRSIAATLLVLSAACTSTKGPTPPVAGTPPSAASVAPTVSGSATPARIVAPDRVLLRAPSGGSFLLHGSYPHVTSTCKRAEQPDLTARYPGSLAVRRAADGTLSIIVTLPFETYLQGIAEVPPSWPTAALEAQAVAARSYALANTGWSGEQGATLTTPICATTSCQVYGGIPVKPVPGIRHWYAAVKRTTGQVLLYQGRPADTVYFSTSNGQTYGNETVFGSAPLPYLRPVVERDDGASPTSHWRVRIGFGDLAAFLARAGVWPKATAISGVSGDGSRVRVTDAAGSDHVVDGRVFRDAVNTWAPCLRPGRFPPGALPVTIPSQWMTASSSGGAAVMSGRGWGHGVGMVQWGAFGKARLGWSTARILAFYYGGLTPHHYPEPGLIHVQVASGLTSIRLRASGSGATIGGRDVGSGTLVITGGAQVTASGSAIRST